MLLDNQMPGMDGIQVISKLRDFIDELNFKSTKIEVIYPEFVLVTAFASLELKSKVDSSV